MQRIVWLVISCFIFASVLVAHADVDPENVVGLWLFEEGGGEVAEDSSGNGHDGQILAGEYDDGKFGQAIRFDGNGEVAIESTEKLQLGDQLTLVAYFNAEELVESRVIIAKNAEYLMRIDVAAEAGGKMSTFINLGGWEPRAATFVPETDRWYHYAAVYDGDANSLVVYIDGVQSGQSVRDGDPNPGVDPVKIGAWNAGSRFIGRIDEVAIFDVALEVNDILNIATNGLTDFLGGGASVQPSGRLTTTWGDLKSQ